MWGPPKLYSDLYPPSFKSSKQTGNKDGREGIWEGGSGEQCEEQREGGREDGKNRRKERKRGREEKELLFFLWSQQMSQTESHWSSRGNVTNDTFFWLVLDHLYVTPVIRRYRRGGDVPPKPDVICL